MTSGVVRSAPARRGAFADGYEFAKQNGKPLFAGLKNPFRINALNPAPENAGFRVQGSFSTMFKLPFKLDRSSFAHKPRDGMGITRR
ncbi:hypothetical protein [Bradyrhizobium sp. HKCCYLS2033]|uniref:hypothetical protein n=1 Tax=unclassified Bradyrhizobium TaxID=2631580 RepID=UPI003EBF85C6